MARQSSLCILVSIGTIVLDVPTASIAAGSPDLVPDEVRVITTSITPGQSMRVSWTMANKGDGDAKASVTGLRLKAVWGGSLKTSCAGPYITLVREIATDMIKAGGWISAQYDVAVPADAPAGGYVVEVVADNSNPSTLGQKDTGNDYAQSGEVTVSSQSASSTGRPLMADMELVPEGAFADPRYPLPLDEKSREHAGTDYRAAGGSCVFAVREGEVESESNRTSTADPMEAVLIIKHGDGSRAYYGHIKSSLGKGSKVARGALLGTVRYPAPKFGSHLHYGEWAPPSDKLIENPETDCEKATWVTKQGDWGWGRVPLGTIRSQMLKCGWIDTGVKYKDGWISYQWVREWVGTQERGKSKNSVVMRLRREGDSLEGLITYPDYSTKFVLEYEVRGTIKGDGKFRLASNHGVFWLGMIAADNSISGEFPNGDPNDPSVPRFPFVLGLVKTLPEGSVGTPRAEGSPTTSDWPKFLEAFRSAIKRQDGTALGPMIANRFDMTMTEACERKCSSKDVLEKLRADAWREVSKAVAGSPKQLSPSPWGRARYLIVDVRPCPECRYKVALDFEQDDNAQWHWVGLHHPGD